VEGLIAFAESTRPLLCCSQVQAPDGDRPVRADFCCREHRLIVELDGEPHETDEARERDRRRDAFLRSEGYRVLRFSNERVLGKLEFVLREIAEHVGLAGRPSSDPASPGHLLPRGEKETRG